MSPLLSRWYLIWYEFFAFQCLATEIFTFWVNIATHIYLLIKMLMLQICLFFLDLLMSLKYILCKVVLDDNTYYWNQLILVLLKTRTGSWSIIFSKYNCENLQLTLKYGKCSNISASFEQNLKNYLNVCILCA